MCAGGQKNRKVAVIEYYAHRLYVSGYEVNASCTGYRKGFSNLKIRYNKAGGNIIKNIRSEFNRNFSLVGGDDILMFCTFTADRYIDKKLMAKDVKAVDDNWENILKTDNDALGKIIRAMVGKNSDQR